MCGVLIWLYIYMSRQVQPYDTGGSRVGKSIPFFKFFKAHKLTLARQNSSC